MAALAAPGEAPRGYPDILPKRRRPRSLRCRSAPFIDHPGQMQRPARHIRPRVRVLNFFSRFTMADFKNRLAAKTRTPSIAPPPRRHPQGCRGAQGAEGVLGLRGGTAEPQGPSALPAGGGGLPGRSSGPAAGGGGEALRSETPPLAAPLLAGALAALAALASSPFIDPPTQMQRPARHIRPRVRVLNFFSRFSMAVFKNRLAKTKPPPRAAHPSHLPPGPPGLGGALGGPTARLQGPRRRRRRRRPPEGVPVRTLRALAVTGHISVGEPGAAWTCHVHMYTLASISTPGRPAHAPRPCRSRPLGSRGGFDCPISPRPRGSSRPETAGRPPCQVGRHVTLPGITPRDLS